ncbi:MAG: integral rane sensor signal transduction histidine kinase [Firmicutes bacterium]|nr:integral rane sensor signal transduction histidine kinase [Bacillota bacterium]
MFRKLLLKLTVLNASVIAILFCALITGAYLFAQYDLNRHVEFFLSKVAADINAGRRPPMFPGPPGNGPLKDSSLDSSSSFTPGPAGPPSPPPPGLPFGPPDESREGEMPRPTLFYAKLDSTGAIVSTSASLPLAKDQLEKLAQVVVQRPKPSGQVTFQNVVYFYHVTARTDSPGQLLLFQNFERERDVFRTIMTALVVIGVVCFIASLFGSLFLARRAMKPIQKSWTQQRDFLADASHELRTPLAVIQANLDVIQSNSDELVAEQTQWLNNIDESVKAMASLVESLLFLARIDSQQHPLDKKLFSLDQAIATATAPYNLLAATKKISLTTDLERSLDFYGDEGRIKQVVGILLDNAIRHTAEGGSVNVVLKQINKSVQLSVSDTGEGIPLDQLNKVFERFYQVDPARNKGGTGLGLSIAKCIVENHDGGIHASCTPGSGASFFVRLPLAASHPLKGA